jgi:hypothetical protein
MTMQYKAFEKTRATSMLSRGHISSLAQLVDSSKKWLDGANLINIDQLETIHAAEMDKG